MSAVQAPTTAALIVAEAMHGTASSDLPELIAALAEELRAIWSVTPAAAVLSQSAPRFAFQE
jgi:DNA/RNA-binding domain of Phe-tRNA-synthetase-like protein